MSIAAAITTAYQAGSVLQVCARALENEHPLRPGDDDAAAELVRLAGDMVGEVIEGLEIIERNPSRNGAADLFTRWQECRAEQKAIAEIFKDDTASPPELEALAVKEESLSQQIAACTPNNSADAAAMLEWCIQDSNGAILSDLYPQAQRAVIDYLTLKGGSLSLVA
ncbi:MAG: hypothetical protein ACJAVM_002117 [Sulfitobacter sp.]|jgi:hypothetical protein